MKETRLHGLFFPGNNDKEIKGLTDDIGYLVLPIFLNCNIIQSNFINYLMNDLTSYTIAYKEDEKKYIPYFKDFKNISDINFSQYFDQDPNSSLYKKLLNTFESISFEKKTNNYFVLSKLDHQFFIDFELLELKRALYKTEILGQSLIFVEVDFFRRILKKYKPENEEKLYHIINKLKAEKIEVEFYDYSFNNVKEYIYIHFKALENNNKLKMFVSNLSSFFHENRISHIDKKGVVENSLIGNNTVVKGKASDSILFDNVIIMPEAEVVNSIILPGNVIGKNAVVKNTIIGTHDNLNNLVTIGNRATIGKALNKNYENIKYKNEIPDGFSLIGNNTVIPPHFKMGKNCVIRNSIDYSKLKEIKSLIDGGTLENESD